MSSDDWDTCLNLITELVNDKILREQYKLVDIGITFNEEEEIEKCVAFVFYEKNNTDPGQPKILKLKSYPLNNNETILN